MRRASAAPDRGPCARTLAGAGAVVVGAATVGAGAACAAGALYSATAIGSATGAGAGSATTRCGAGEPGTTSSDSDCVVQTVGVRGVTDPRGSSSVSPMGTTFIVAARSSPAGAENGTNEEIGSVGEVSVRTTVSLCWQPMTASRVREARMLRREFKSVLVDI